MKKVIGVLAVLVLIGLWACSGSDSKGGTAASESAGSSTEVTEDASVDTEITEDAPVDTETETAASETEDDMTLGQRNAVRAAQNYLEFSAFSRDGLLLQLTSEYGSKYPEEEAEYAITYLEEKGLVDWNEQAVKAAENYLEISSFSKEGLIDQLSSEYGSRFTKEQAEYAAEQLGY